MKTILMKYSARLQGTRLKECLSTKRSLLTAAGEYSKNRYRIAPESAKLLITKTDNVRRKSSSGDYAKKPHLYDILWDWTQTMSIFDLPPQNESLIISQRFIANSQNSQ